MSFLVFCLALLILFSAVAWWLGGPLLRLAFASEQRLAPYHVLYFANVDSVPPDTAPQAGALEYGRGFDALLATDTAQLLWRAGTVTVPAGSVLDEWRRVDAVRFVSGSEFVRLVTGANYRQLRDRAPGGERVVFGLSQPPRDLALSPELLLVAAELPQEQPPDLAGFFGPAQLVGARIVWDSPMVTLEGSDAYDRMLLLGFPDTASLDGWLWSAETQTQLALLRARLRQVRVWRLGSLSR